MYLRSHLTPGRDQKDPSPTVRVWELLSLWGGVGEVWAKSLNIQKTTCVYNIIIITIHTHTHFSQCDMKGLSEIFVAGNGIHRAHI